MAGTENSSRLTNFRAGTGIPVHHSQNKVDMELNELDEAILAELTQDPFASNSAVADKLGVSTSRVASRLRTLERDGVSQVLAVLDLDHLGQSFCFLYIQVRDRPVADVAMDICSSRLVLMVNELLDGTADLLVLVRFADVHSLHAVLGDLARVAGVARWRVDIVTDVPVFRSEYVTFGQRHQPLSIEQNSEYLEQDIPEGMCDETDRLIIAHLQQNAHQSINTVARKLGLKPSTARYRINNLKTSGILRFIRVIDKSWVGIDRFTLVELSVDLRRIDTIVEALRDKEWLPQLFRSIGGADFLAIALTAGVDEILRIKREELLTIDGVIEARLTSLHTNHKTDYRWAQRTTG